MRVAYAYILQYIIVCIVQLMQTGMYTFQFRHIAAESFLKSPIIIGISTISENVGRIKFLLNITKTFTHVASFHETMIAET